MEGISGHVEFRVKHFLHHYINTVSSKEFKFGSLTS